jgi:glycogen phosphorylase
MAGQANVVEKLRELTRNLWWTWQPHDLTLFNLLDPDLWRDTNHNPVEFLAKVPSDRLEAAAEETALHSRIDYGFRRLSEYLHEKETWSSLHASALRTRPVAYFSAEFGLHESLPIYSGGLGVLAGDHLKSASDLGVPLVGIGLLYAQGYFQQTLDANGWQQEQYLNTNIETLPIEAVKDAFGNDIRVSIDSHAGVLHARAWRVEVGRTTLYLLDSNVPENNDYDRALTSRLYGGDARVRIRQELLLGVGGVRLLDALGIGPSVLHLNEGHSAFAVVEMIRSRMERDGIPFNEAARDASAMTVFTTHTPVAAGHDRFPAPLVEEHLGKIREAIHLGYDDFMGLGRIHTGDLNEPFTMTVLALKLSRHANAVSALHGRVSRQMWKPLYPNRTEEQVPIGHITNGVHVMSWLSAPMRGIFNRVLGPQWPHHMSDPTIWRAIKNLDDSELWETQQVLKAALIKFVRERLVRQAKRRNDPDEVVEAHRHALDLNVLTIGFARRFATYKRAGLVLRDVERLREMVGSSDRPVQFVFAGKAHPEDHFGKELMQNIVRFTKDPEFRNRIVFVEDYDMNVARYLVQGVDVWLNNPRRPQEASGTSGEKALLNGGLNFSILDGWWAEAYDGTNGFAIGRGESHAVTTIQDDRDHAALLKTLSTEIVPLYYDRDALGLPRNWIARQKSALISLAGRFNADRMVMDYVKNCYLPAAGFESCAIPLA